MKILNPMLWALLAGVIALGGCNSPKYKGKTASMWAGDLGSKDDYKRRLACQSLGMMGPEAASQAEKIGPLLNDVNLGVQGFCAEALSKMGPAVIPIVKPHLKSPEPFVRVHAAGVIIKIDPQSEEAQKTLIDAFAGLGNAVLAKMAKEIILRQEGLMVPELTEVLGSPFADLRLEAVKTLGLLAQKARPAADALIKIAQSDKDWKVRKAAMHSVATVATVEQSTPMFRHAIEEENEEQEEVRDAAAMMLTYTGVRKGTTGTVGAEEAKAEEEAKAAAAAKNRTASGISITIK